MQLNNLTLAYLVEELKPLLRGAFINKIQEVEESVFKFKLRTVKGSKDLIINLQKNPVIYLTEFKFEAPAFPHGYGLFLKKHLIGKKIEEIKQYSFERIILIEFQELNLVIELFAEGNLILLDREGNILLPFRKEKFKDRELKKNVKYELPPSRGLNPLTLNEEDLKKVLANSEKDLIRALIEEINIAPIYVEDILLQLKIEKNLQAKKVNEKQVQTLKEKINELYLIDLKKFRPNIVLQDKKEVLVPIKLTAFKSEKEFKELNEALDSIYSKPVLIDKKKGIQEKFEKELKKLEFSLREQEQARKRFEALEAEFTKKGELLYSNYSFIQEVINGIKKGMEKNLTEKEIMYKFDLAVDKRIILVNPVKKIDWKNKKLFLDLK